MDLKFFQMFSETQVVIMLLVWVVWGSHYLQLHLHLHFCFPVSLFVGKYWDLSEKFTSCWVAVTNAASSKFVCGSGCESRVSTRGWNDQGHWSTVQCAGLKQTGPPLKRARRVGDAASSLLVKDNISLSCLRLGLCVTAIRETWSHLGRFRL